MSKILAKLNKLSLPATIVIASVILGGFYFAGQMSKQLSIEKQQRIELEAKQKTEQVEEAEEVENKRVEAIESKGTATFQEAVNDCITDAYAETKTRKENLERIYFHACSVSTASAGCDAEWVAQTKKEWDARYKDEWTPQCKLGNRVFTHTEAYYP